MLSGSILGKINNCWEQSACYKLCSVVLSFFSRAWSGSVFRKLLLRLAGLVSADGQGHSAAASAGGQGRGVLRSLLRRVSVFFVNAAGAQERRLAPANGSSLFVSAASGSAALKPGRAAGIVFLVMFCVPHSAWRNWYALVAAAVVFGPLRRCASCTCIIRINSLFLISGKVCS